MLVIAVLGLLATLVVSRMDAVLPTYRLRLAAREVASAIAWARLESVGGSTPMTVRYDLDTGEYGVFPADADADATPAADLSPTAARLRRMALPDGVHFDDLVILGGETVRSGRPVIGFTFLGACPPHMIHLKDDDGNAFTIEVMPLSSQVNLTNHRVEARHVRGP